MFDLYFFTLIVAGELRLRECSSIDHRLVKLPGLTLKLQLVYASLCGAGASTEQNSAATFGYRN